MTEGKAVTNQAGPVDHAKGQSLWTYFQNRVMAGLFATLPLFLTLWVIQFTYFLMIDTILNPLLQLILKIAGITARMICPCGGA